MWIRTRALEPLFRTEVPELRKLLRTAVGSMESPSECTDRYLGSQD